jgi:hypothetical protein
VKRKGFLYGKILIEMFKSEEAEYFLLDRHRLDEILRKINNSTKRIQLIEYLCKAYGIKLGQEDLRELDRKICEFYSDEHGLRYIGYTVIKEN